MSEIALNCQKDAQRKRKYAPKRTIQLPDGILVCACCPGGGSVNLMEVSVDIIDTAVCNQNTVYGGRVTDNMLCAGDLEGGRDSCQVSQCPGGRFRMAERLGNRAINQKVAGSIPGRANMTLCPWARHLPRGNVPVLTYYNSLWIRASAQ